MEVQENITQSPLNNFISKRSSLVKINLITFLTSISLLLIKGGQLVIYVL